MGSVSSNERRTEKDQTGARKSDRQNMNGIQSNPIESTNKPADEQSDKESNQFNQSINQSARRRGPAPLRIRIPLLDISRLTD
jgi:hypothetical protein